MTQYDNSNRIALWMNDKREKATHPHLRGSGETDKEVWASAWLSDEISDEDKKALQGILKRYDSKKPFISISLQAKDQQGGSQQRNQANGANASNDFDDNSIPF